MLAPETIPEPIEDSSSGQAIGDTRKRTLPFRRYFDQKLEPITEEQQKKIDTANAEIGEKINSVSHLPKSKKKCVPRVHVKRNVDLDPSDVFSVTIPSGVFDWSIGTKVNVVEIKKPMRRPAKWTRTGDNQIAKISAQSAAGKLRSSWLEFENHVFFRHRNRRSDRILMAAILVILYVVVAITLVGIGTGFQARTVKSSPSQTPSTAQLKVRMFTAADSKNHLEQFFAATTTDAALPMVWNHEETAKHMQSYYARPGVTMGGKITGDKPTIAKVSNRSIHWWLVQTPDGIDRIAGVLWDSNQPYLLWEHLVGYGECSWDVFLESTPENSATMRIVIRVPEQTLPFMGNACWAVVSHPDSTTTSYAVVTDPIAAQHLNEFFLSGEEGTLATVEMGFRKVPNGKPLLEIRRLIWPDWGEKALDLSELKRTGEGNAI